MASQGRRLGAAFLENQQKAPLARSLLWREIEATTRMDAALRPKGSSRTLGAHLSRGSRGVLSDRCTSG
jgi:hypothetical protein